MSGVSATESAPAQPDTATREMPGWQPPSYWPFVLPALIVVLAVIIFLVVPRFFPKVPGAIVAVGVATIVVLEQVMHNPKFEGKTVKQLRDELAATTGENVVIRRFARFAIGQ